MADAELECLAAHTGVVLLYHAVFEQVPAPLLKGLHNVRPEVLQSQLECIRRHFKFVDVDEMAALDDPRGYASLTFDDGYRSVFEQALPICEKLDIPLTVFLNGSNFEDHIFWRDKVRLIENMDWVEEFESGMQGILAPEGKRFYRYTKMRGNNSGTVDAELDRFLESKGAASDLRQHCMDSVDALPGHTLLSYGNHGHHHYLMSSLSPAQQEQEIVATNRLLDSLGRRKLSRVFSVPFGEESDFDSSTSMALRRHGYETVLLSRNRLHAGSVTINDINAVDRFMPRTDDPDAGLHRVLLAESE